MNEDFISLSELFGEDIKIPKVHGLSMQDIKLLEDISQKAADSYSKYKLDYPELSLEVRKYIYEEAPQLPNLEKQYKFTYELLKDLSVVRTLAKIKAIKDGV